MEISQVFDANYYAGLYPDLGVAGLSTPDQLLNHFVAYGVDEGRSFSPYVDLNYYRELNPDLTAAGLTTHRDLLSHLTAFGLNEKRFFSPNVDLNYYSAVNPDLGAAGLTGGEQIFDHLINYGVREGRQIVPPPPTTSDSGSTEEITDFPDFPNFPPLPGLPSPQAASFGGGNLLLGGPSNRISMSPDLNIVLATGVQSAITKLQDFLTNPDLASKITTAFGEGVNIDAATSLIQELANAKSLPTIKMATIDELAGNQGAFDALTNTAYISQEFLRQQANNPENIASVILEEIGHSIDSRINAVDAHGDEGAIFSELVRGNQLREEDLSKWKNENDITTLTIGNSNISVELSKQWALWVYDWNIFQGSGFIGSTTVNGSGNGINLDWGSDSADRFNQVYFGDWKDEFVAIAGAWAYFEAGKEYTFRASADDALLIAAVSYSNPSNYPWITPQWEIFDHSQGNPGYRSYNFKPQETGWYAVYTYLAEFYGGAYIDVSWNPGTAKADKNGETIPIHIKSIDNQPITDKNTWLVIHGNANSEGNMSDLANAIKSNDPNSQVLTLDWSKGANSGLNKSTKWIQPVAQAARNLLTDFGISNKNINLVGHSLGAYVSWEIAKSTPGGVKNIIALDPANQVIGILNGEEEGYDPKDVNFADYSDWSWGFYGSNFGSDRKAATADEYFQMDFESWSVNPNDYHGWVHQSFADLLEQNNSLWSLNRMNSWNKPWTIDYGSQLEATISFRKDSNNQWQVSQLRDSRGARIAS